ncbi:MAG: sigma-70 family RNA polymerase sigma factor [Planctomycetes bacterium]|nr:sigma-70 family RNA polymerase sigma factor [Planctomycetota bacterium]
MTLPKSDTAPHLEALLSHSAWVKHLARAIATSRDLADEVEQEAWRLALERPPRHTRNLKAWWSSVVRNSVIQKRRSEARYQKRVDRLQPSATSRADGDPSVLSESMEDFGLLARYVNELPPQLGEAIFLRFFQDKSVPQIAIQLGVAQTAVKSRLRRGLEQLRGRFQSVHGENWRARCLALAAPSTPTFSLTTITALIFMSTKTKLIAAGILGISLVCYSLWPPEAEPISEVEELPIEAELAEIETQLEPDAQNVRTEQLPEKAPTYLSHRERNSEIPLPGGAVRDAWFQLTVLDHEGNPWPDLPLDLTGWPGHIFKHRYHTTNVNGELRIPCISGDWDMVLSSKTRDGGNDLSFSKDFSLAPNEVAEIKIHHPGWNQVHGVITDFESNPFEGIKIQYWGNGGKSRRGFNVGSSQLTSADGTFSIKALNGEYSISASTEYQLAINVRGKVIAGAPVEPVRIQFPETRLVALEILDIEGLGIGVAEITFARNDVPRNSAPNGLSYTFSRLGKTDSKGRKIIEAPIHMKWPLKVHHPKLGEILVEIPLGVTEFQYQVPAGSTCHGVVVDHQNKPIPGAKVKAWAPAPHLRDSGFLIPREDEWLFSMTDSDGKFSINRLAESQSGFLFVEAKGKAYVGLRNINFPTGDSDLEIQLFPEQTISGTLLDLADVPVKSRVIQLNGNPCFGSNTEWENLPFYAGTYRIRTDENGRFHFNGLGDGQIWKIDVHKIHDFEPAAFATVQSGEQGLVIHLGDGFGELINVEVSVVDSQTGSMVSDLVVKLWHPRIINGEFAGAGADGARIRPKLPQAVFSGKEVVDHIVQVDAPGYSSARALIPAKAGLHQVKVKLEKASKVHFRFQDKAGNVLPKRWVRVRSVSGEISTGDMGISLLMSGNGLKGFDSMTNKLGDVELMIPLLGGHFEIEAPDSDTPIQIPFGPELATAEGMQIVVVGG